MFDVLKLRQDFPILQKKFEGKSLVYFDNACMSLRPQPVIDEITRYYTELSGCAGRSNHRLAQGVSEAVDVARVKVQKFLHAKFKEEIIFTRNTTEGINLVARSLNLEADDVVLTSGKEHNSNLVPWLKLVKELGIVHKIIPQKQDNSFDMVAFKKLLTKEVKLVAIVQTSNLDGVTFPIKEIAKLAYKVGALVLVDAAQSAPHQKIDVQDLGADFVAFSGHKLMGPSGMGVLYGKKKHLEKMDGFLVGGDTVEWTTYTGYKHLPIPEKFEAGLQDYAGIMGLGIAVEYLSKIGWENIRQQELKLNTIITEGLEGEKRVRIIGPKDPALRGGIVAFTLDGADPHQIALLLDSTAGIAVRSGQHCVHSWFDAHKIKGSIRASLYVYNTVEEAEYFVESLKKILAVV
jgi:cysteine desulfurase / selenocysteine lyase